ncbi:MAG: hypothetical protein CMF96_01000 [Candidatus Marinimicrobia bacterium]|nr:hypothetical protein [Candidatus Neomarinimicrobiota bacterium]
MKKIFIFIIMLGNLFPQSFPYFDGERAFQYLLKQCDLGPRNPGSKGHADFIKMLDQFLLPFNLTVFKHEVTVTNPITQKPVDLTNFLVRFNHKREKRLLILAHWDTRDVADRDPVLANQDNPILGANDGASGIAILMELINILHNNPLINIGLDLLFVDGEDMGVSGVAESFALGTKEFAREYPSPLPYFGLGIDMVGDKNLEIEIERFSYYQAPQYVDKIWTLAKKLQIHQFKHRLGRSIYDDHRVFYLETKIPTVNLIDFKYPDHNHSYWHTLNDIPENCSSESLEAVGRLVTAFIYNEDVK